MISRKKQRTYYTAQGCKVTHVYSLDSDELRLEHEIVLEGERELLLEPEKPRETALPQRYERKR